jgi:acetoin utilization deacetylase AcuC-like enzyme
MRKYRLLRERVAAGLPGVLLTEPPAATDGQLALAHTPRYVQSLCTGRLSASELRKIGFPWSLEMVERARRSVGATISACRAALRDGAAANLAGGTHHAYADHGEGFCCFNDLAVASQLMQAERLANRVLIIDLDVHQGNGTASILGRDRSVMTVSIHGEHNYPFEKETSHIDVALADGTGDEVYLAVLSDTLDRIDQLFTPDLVLYLAGADVFEGDRLGRLNLTIAGIQARDAMVFAWAQARKLPIAVVMGGGYCPDIDLIAQIHFNTIQLAASLVERK